MNANRKESTMRTKAQQEKMERDWAAQQTSIETEWIAKKAREATITANATTLLETAEIGTEYKLYSHDDRVHGTLTKTGHDTWVERFFGASNDKTIYGVVVYFVSGTWEIVNA